MGSREQFIKTVNHQQTDKIVIDLGATAVTGIHALAVERLRNYFGLEKKPVRIIDPFQMLGEVGDDLAEAIGVDVAAAWGKNNIFGFYNHAPFKMYKTPWGQEVLVPENFNTSVDGEGNTYIYPEGDIRVKPSGRMPKSGYFFDAIIRQYPVDDTQLSPDDNLEEFGLVNDNDLLFWNDSATKARATGKAVIASFGGTALGDIALVPGMQMKDPKGIRDIAEWYMSTILRPDYIKTVFEKQTEIAIENFKRLKKVTGDNIDAVFICGTDFGTQESTFCSPGQFDDMWLPYYRKINDWVHLNTHWKTFKHSCGAVGSFMKHFIEAGFDIINPVQINAAGMDPVHLKKTYGKDLVFWGGGIDTQKTLPYASPGKVREETLRLCEIFSKDGGFVFNTVHNIQANVPVENIVAMIGALKELNEK
ncbi:MAG: uroporphyrinogen decarboxylase family protein [Prolixibacteraceae bacterium]|jgi:hypothetical protein|nr:uroporphyrinogen decarboxylase family protein [Prolixibacteraceae bacterium]